MKSYTNVSNLKSKLESICFNSKYESRDYYDIVMALKRDTTYKVTSKRGSPEDAEFKVTESLANALRAELFKIFNSAVISKDVEFSERLILELHYLEDLDMNEIGRLIGKTGRSVQAIHDSGLNKIIDKIATIYVDQFESLDRYLPDVEYKSIDSNNTTNELKINNKDKEMKSNLNVIARFKDAKDRFESNVKNVRKVAKDVRNESKFESFGRVITLAGSQTLPDLLPGDKVTLKLTKNINEVIMSDTKTGLDPYYRAINARVEYVGTKDNYAEFTILIGPDKGRNVLIPISYEDKSADVVTGDSTVAEITPDVETQSEITKSAEIGMTDGVGTGKESDTVETAIITDGTISDAENTVAGAIAGVTTTATGNSTEINKLDQSEIDANKVEEDIHPSDAKTVVDESEDKLDDLTKLESLTAKIKLFARGKSKYESKTPYDANANKYGSRSESRVDPIRFVDKVVTIDDGEKPIQALVLSVDNNLVRLVKIVKDKESTDPKDFIKMSYDEFRTSVVE